MPIRIEVRNIKVRSLEIDHQEISWEVAPFSSAQADIFDYTFAVLLSGGPEGPYEELSPEMEDQYIFINNKLDVRHPYRQYFYKIRVTEKTTGDTKEFGPVQQEAEADLIAMEVRKHMNLLFREFIGRRCWVFPIRTFGQRCECFNSILGKKTRSGCITCYDTGFVRGYFSPIEIWFSIDPNAQSLQQTNVGELAPQNTTGRTGYWPPVKPRDLIVEPENVRWRVVQVNQTEQLRAALHQELALHQIPKSDIEYSLKFDIGDALRNVYLSPARNFTNPHTLENFEREEIPKIFGLYPTSYPPIKT